MTGWRGNRRVLVTGASGLVGHAVVQRLRAEGAAVTAFGRDNGPDLAAAPWPRGPWDVIVHCAARLPARFEGPDAEAAVAENRKMDDRAIEAAAAGAHLVFLSSASVYGTTSGMIDETTPPAPVLGYAKAKLETEQAIATRGLSGTVLRLVSPYGPRQTRPTVLRRFLDAALTGAPLRYYGTGARTQDFIHVDDIAAAVGKAARDRVTGLFVLASGQSITMRDLAELIIAAAGSSSPIEAAGVPDPEDSRMVRYSVHALREKLAAPEIALADGVKAWAVTRRAELSAGTAS